MALIGCMLVFASPVFAIQNAPVVATPAAPTAGVPEIDAGMLGSGLTLLAGGLMILRSRFRTS